ncbi:MAG TPA: twin-arginine translocation signal domain-containing protein [Ilumatobacter sp.]
MTGPRVGTTRRDFIVRGAQLAAVLGIGAPLLQACGGDDDDEAVTEPIDDGLEPEAGPLRVFNYADYVNPDVVASFEEKYGVKVDITTFDVDA